MDAGRGGGGVSRMIEEGTARARRRAVFACDWVPLPPSASASPRACRTHLAGDGRFASGASAQSVRADSAPQRSLFHRDEADENPIWWFGGGMDLTPYYGFDEDAVHFHRAAAPPRAVRWRTSIRAYKKWCDEYFFLKHRNEPRGIGGIFFDDSRRGRLRALPRLHAQRRRPFPPRVRADLAPQGHAVRRARARLPALPARPLRRVQPACGTAARCFGLQSGGRTNRSCFDAAARGWRYEWPPHPGRRKRRYIVNSLPPGTG